MRCYETVAIFTPELEPPQVEEEVKVLTSFITENGGVVTKVENWGKKRFAYEIEKKKEGTYVLLRYRGDGELVSAIDRACKLSHTVLRQLTVVRDEEECAKIETPSQEEPKDEPSPTETVEGESAQEAEEVE
jgi:small subunit ribosomal protein S6